MKEDFNHNTLNKNRLELVKAAATLDASRYIKLMKVKSPENLELEADGTLTINTVDGEEAFHNTIVTFALNAQEVALYLSNLSTEVKRIILLGKI